MRISDWSSDVCSSDLVLYQGFSLLPKTIKLLMGAVPDDVEFHEIVEALRGTEGVADVHHVHVWSLDEHDRALEAHLVPSVASLEAFEAVNARARATLRRSEERRVGKECVSTCRSRWSPAH